MRAVAKDLRFALRNLLRHPVFAATAVLSLSLGIGANTAIFTLTNQILLRVLPVKEPQRLVSFTWTGQFIGGTSRGYQDSFSYPMYADLRNSSDGFTGISARYLDAVDVSDNGPAQRATAELVSGNYFEVLGVTAALGRVLTPGDDKLKGGEPYVVLSYDYWRSRRGSVGAESRDRHQRPSDDRRGHRAGGLSRAGNDEPGGSVRASDDESRRDAHLGRHGTTE